MLLKKRWEKINITNWIWSEILGMQIISKIKAIITLVWSAFKTLFNYPFFKSHNIAVLFGSLYFNDLIFFIYTLQRK